MAIGMRPNSRRIRPEILDGLPATDARAIRSRRDLRLINRLMGNFPWVLRALAAGGPYRAVAEIGAGEGRLCALLARRFPSAAVTGIDLVPRPAGLSETVRWKQGDIFQMVPGVEHDALVGVMIAHHFSGERLREIGAMARKAVCLCEPLRSPLSHLWAGLLLPFVGPVTRHDMPASITAGFRKGELPALLGLAEEKWTIRESVDWRGSIRLLAWKN